MTLRQAQGGPLRRAQGKARPGDRLRALAARICAPATRERLIDPLIADLQFEHALATRAGRPWRARRLRLSACIAVWRTLGLCATRSAAVGTRDWAAADGHAMGRTLGYSAGIITALVFLLALMPLAAVLRRADAHPLGMLFLYLIPQAIPLAVVFGLPLGILVGLRGRTATSRVRWNVMGLAFVCAVLTFIICAWVLPEANQAFRLLVVGRPAYLAKGANELTFGELIARLAAIRRAGSPPDATPFVFSFHARLAASIAPIIWGGFAMWLASVTRRTLVSTVVFVVAGITYIAYANFVINGGTETSLWVPLAYAIWLPNALFSLMTLALWMVTRRSEASRSSGGTRSLS